MVSSDLTETITSDAARTSAASAAIRYFTSPAGSFENGYTARISAASDTARMVWGVVLRAGRFIPSDLSFERDIRGHMITKRKVGAYCRGARARELGV